MSESVKYPIITVKAKDPSKPPTGANTVVLLDGKPIPMAHFVKVECHARRITKVVLEIFAHAEIETMGEFTTRIIPLKPSKK